MLRTGCFVTHAKLPDLGSGEVLMSSEGITRIRFASGERVFQTQAVEPFLTVTAEAPPAKRPATKGRRTAAKG